MVLITNSQVFIGKSLTVIIDRPRLSAHPIYKSLIYELDYGYIPDTFSGDGEELDAYVFGRLTDFKMTRGFCIGVIKRPDGDDKLIVASSDIFLNANAEIVWQKTGFQENFFWPIEYIDRDGRYEFYKGGVKKKDD
jgi:inorganic pyrophosphatase